MVQLAPLPSRQTVRMSANFRKHTLQCYCITHHKQDFKCRHNFLLLQGVIWCCIDVIVFMAGPLILSNLQQTGAAVTAYVCLQPPSPCVSMCPAVVTLSRLHAPYNHNCLSHVNPPASAPNCDLSHHHRWAEFHVSQREHWHNTTRFSWLGTACTFTACK